MGTINRFETVLHRPLGKFRRSRIALAVGAGCAVAGLSLAAPGATTDTWTGATNATWDTSTANWSDVGGGTTFANGDAAVFDDGSGANTVITVSSGIAPGSIEFAHTATGTALNYSFTGGIGGAGTLTVDASYAGTITLNSINTFSGGTTLNGGTLIAGAGGSATASTLGAGAPVTVNAGTLQLTAGDALGYFTANPSTLTIGGTVTINSGIHATMGNITFNGGTLSSAATSTAVGYIFDGTIASNASATTATISAGGDLRGNYQGASNNNNTVTFNVAAGTTTSGVDLLVSGTLYNAGTGNGLIKSGAGVLELSANNSYTGATSVNAGTLIVAGPGSATASTVGAATVVTVASGATLQLASTDALGYYAANPSSLNINGTVTINAGLHATLGNLAFTGGTLAAAGAGNGTNGQNFIFDGTVTTSASATTALISASGGIGLRGNYDNTNPAAPSVTFNVAQGTTTTGIDMNVTSTIGAYGGSTSGLTKSGPGTLELSADETYTGPTIVNAGTLVLNGAGGTIGTLNAASALGVTGATVQVNNTNGLGGYTDANIPAVTLNAGGTLTIANGFTAHLNSITLAGGTLASGTTPSTTYGSWSIDAGLGVSAASTTSTISATQVGLNQAGGTTFNVAAGTSASKIDLDVTGTIVTIGGSGYANTALVKSGAGVMRLDSANTYTGGTQVTGGTLLVANTSGSGVGTAAVSVASGGTLGGNGSISGAVTVASGGSIAPSGPFTTPLGAPLTITGATSFTDNTSKYAVNLVSAAGAAGVGYDQLRYGNTLALNNATLSVSDAGYTFHAGDKFWIIDAASGNSATADAVSGQFNGLPNNSTYYSPGGIQYSVQYNVAGDPDTTGNDVLLTVVSTPEPASLGLLALSAGLLLRRRRLGA